MNDLKTKERSCLGSEVLRNLMLWHYYGKKIAVADLPVTEILQEWYTVCDEDGLASVRPHRQSM